MSSYFKKTKVSNAKVSKELEKVLDENVTLKKKIVTLNETVKNLNTILTLTVKEVNTLYKRLGHRECFICKVDKKQKLIELPCCPNKMCKGCWSKHGYCPFCSEEMVSLENRLLELHNY